jgi:hypothetical protein
MLAQRLLKMLGCEA